ncbi:ABC transporter permease [Amycolatopsis thailandensis]|uniref:ABC transporter permease n=1 Tax=Amycolatopsis thailandensis TaxID=589330 RepID=UPI0036568C05
MAGRLLLVLRLLVRDLRRRPAETLLLLIAITAATGTLTLGLALDEGAALPYEHTRSATAGPDVVARPLSTGDDALADLAPLTTAPGVTGHSGPYPVAFLELTARGKAVQAVVEGRDTAPSALDRPAITVGTWLRPGGVVVERAFAEALGVHPGDTVDVGGHALRVLGIAVTAARTTYPYAGWHFPGSPLSERGGLVWVHDQDIATLTGGEQTTYTMNLALDDPAASKGFIGRVRPSLDRADFDGGLTLTTWQDIADLDGRPVERAQEPLLIGSWLLTALAVAGVSGIVAGRIAGQRRRVGLLKAVGAGPAMVAFVHLAEYLVVGLTAAGAGLVTSWLAAPALIQPNAGLLTTDGPPPPSLSMVVVAAALAFAIAVAATLAPAARAVAISTTAALADSAAPPRRSRWRVRLSRRLPVTLLIGVRMNARRPHRAWLVTVNTFITTAALVAVLMNQAQDRPFRVGDAELANPLAERTGQSVLVVTVVVLVLAVINTAVSTWTAVLDTRHPLAVARTLGATPGQTGLGLTVAQLLPALPGAAAGIPCGLGLFLFAWRGQPQYPPGSWLLAPGLGILLTITLCTAISALALSRRPIAHALQTR